MSAVSDTVMTEKAIPGRALSLPST